MANDVTESVDGDPAELTPLLDQLHSQRVLDRSYDGARAANIAEYRNQHYVYQFTQAGYRAYRAVEDVLGASLGRRRAVAAGVPRTAGRPGADVEDVLRQVAATRDLVGTWEREVRTAGPPSRAGRGRLAEHRGGLA